jgi:hypothetical protein
MTEQPSILYKALKRAKRVFSEDECAPDAESLSRALQRLHPDLSRPVLEEDWGDCIVTLYCKGVLTTAGPPRCGWNDIYQLPEEDPLYQTYLGKDVEQ